MKIPNKRELQQIAFNHSSDIDFQDFMNLYKKCTVKPYYVFVSDTTLASDNSSRFRKDLLERIFKLIVTTDDKIIDEKIQYDNNREAGKISVLSSGKIDKYEYRTCEEILPSGQCGIIEQAKFTYSPLSKVFEKQIKTTKDKGTKQVEALKALKLEKNKEDITSIEEIFPKVMRTNEIKNEVYEIKKWEEKIKWEDLKYQTKKYTYDFQQYETVSKIFW